MREGGQDRKIFPRATRRGGNCGRKQRRVFKHKKDAAPSLKEKESSNTTNGERKEFGGKDWEGKSLFEESHHKEEKKESGRDGGVLSTRIAGGGNTGRRKNGSKGALAGLGNPSKKYKRLM